MRLKKFILSAMAALVLVGGCTGAKAKNGEQEIAGDKQELKTNNDNKKMAKTINLTRDEFLSKVANYEANPQEWKYLGDKPCLIDFYADWCGPCKMVAPILDELSEEYKGKVDVFKIDTEKEQELAAVFGIQSIPSLLFVPMEGQPQMAMGALPKETFEKAISDVLKVEK